MDQFTIRNLELVSSSVDNGATLLKTIDATTSPMGARLLKRWILMPLSDQKKINERLDLVEKIIANSSLYSTFTQSFKSCGDIERLVSKIPSKKLGPREMLQLAKGLEEVAFMKSLHGEMQSEYLERLLDSLNPCSVISEKINLEISEDAPNQTQKGGYIRAGVS